MENKIIYLDNAATTKPSPAAAEAMMCGVDMYANPSSLHGAGFKVEKLVEKAREDISSILGADKKNLYFTSGGTEANNLAIFGAANALKRRGNKVITSKIEHPSVLEAFKKLENDGFNVVFADVDKDGIVNVDKLSDELTDDTILVSIMHVNNETGVIQPISEISKLIRARSKNALFHSDCVQSFGKIPLSPDILYVDMLSVSAHKIHGFKGVGALYTRYNNLTPVLYGGEQQGKVRPGTENTAGVFAFAAAARECTFNFEKMQKKRELMINALSCKIPDIKINGSSEKNSGSVLNVSFLGIKAEILLHSLERHNIYVSTGSACSSHKPQPSHVLTAMGLSQKEIEGAIRISFCEYTEDSDILFAAEKIAEEVTAIRKYIR